MRRAIENGRQTLAARTFSCPRRRVKMLEPWRRGGDILTLTTLRSNDQFNTTVYGYSDRYRGVEGTRMVAFMNPDDIVRLGLTEGEHVNLVTALQDDVKREVKRFRIVSYPVARGCVAAYFPEATPTDPVVAS